MTRSPNLFRLRFFCTRNDRNRLQHLPMAPAAGEETSLRFSVPLPCAGRISAFLAIVLLLYRLSLQAKILYEKLKSIDCKWKVISYYYSKSKEHSCIRLWKMIKKRWWYLPEVESYGSSMFAPENTLRMGHFDRLLSAELQRHNHPGQLRRYFY